MHGLMKRKAIGVASIAICVCWGLAERTAKGQDIGITYADLQSGYWLNYEQFKSLYVSWRHVTFPHENAIRRYEDAWRSETPQQREALRKASGRREEQNEFWTDREAFQVRTPAVLVPDRDAPGREFDFPQRAARKGNLMTDFKEIGVYNYNGDLADGIKFWNGVLQGLPQGAVLSRLRADAPGRLLPPLALHYPVSGFVQHPFDAFFRDAFDEARVVGRVDLDGHNAFVVEKVIPQPDGRKRLRLFVEHAGEDINKLTLQEVQRAWIDMERGCLPLRMEIMPRLTYDGKIFDDIWGFGPNTVIETQKIEKVDGGGFYPSRVRRVSFSSVDRDPRATPISFKEIIGRSLPKREAAPDLEGQWVTEVVEAGRDMTGLFAFDFPDSMVYYDFRTSKVMGKTYDDAKPGAGAATRGRKGAEDRLIRYALIGANLLLVLVLAGVVLFRRYHGLRGVKR